MLLLQGLGGHGQPDSVVKIKSLPFDATQLDIIQFFEAYRLKPNGVQLVVRSDNKPTGEVRIGDAHRWHKYPAGRIGSIAIAQTSHPLSANLQAFVDFENLDEAARAIREKDHKVFSEKFGDRYVRLIQVR